MYATRCDPIPEQRLTPQQNVAFDLSGVNEFDAIANL